MSLDSGFGGGSSYRSSSSSSIKRDYEGASEAPQQKLDLDGLTLFEKNFYVESSSVAAMSESEVEEYRRCREITVEGKDVPKPVKAFQDVGFPVITWQSFLFMLRVFFQSSSLVEFKSAITQ
ncbi:DEAD-box ATP-dependent RNA helicase 20-like [Forsythia ovata]|uniref:DEAD-box ATP-dependent RNA helicase 20-like n=1 Tax=Forsythia ovata TaxID=205694 RepID=A0ABD1S415_9LAMI